MAPLPKRRHSRRRQGVRVAAKKLPDYQFQKCPNCGNILLPHRICRVCGYYKGKEILKPKTKKSKEKTKS